MKTYAKQIPPEYQESPLDWFGIDTENEGIILDGNRDYKSHTTAVYDDIMQYFDEMSNEWEDANFWYSYEAGTEHYKTVRHKKSKPDCSIAELLSDYGFEREDGKAWSNQQKHTWRLIMENGNDFDDDNICTALELITGHKWETGTIRGCCQGDWQDVIYRTDMWSRESLNSFEMEYFNLGTEWMIHDEQEEPEGPEDVTGYSVYCYSYDIDGIREEIAEQEGCKPEDVILYSYTGFHKVSDYEIA